MFIVVIVNLERSRNAWGGVIIYFYAYGTMHNYALVVVNHVHYTQGLPTHELQTRPLVVLQNQETNTILLKILQFIEPSEQYKNLLSI